MPVYDPSGHALLSAAAQRLGVEALAAHAEAAEAVLGRGGTLLSETTFEDGTDEHDRAVLAVVYQVNYQVESGTDAEVYSQQERGARRSTFRGGVLAGMPIVSRRAQAIVDTLISAGADVESWPAARGLR